MKLPVKYVLLGILVVVTGFMVGIALASGPFCQENARKDSPNSCPF